MDFVSSHRLGLYNTSYHTSSYTSTQIWLCLSLLTRTHSRKHWIGSWIKRTSLNLLMRDGIVIGDWWSSLSLKTDCLCTPQLLISPAQAAASRHGLVSLNLLQAVSRRPTYSSLWSISLRQRNSIWPSLPSVPAHGADNTGKADRRAC